MICRALFIGEVGCFHSKMSPAEGSIKKSKEHAIPKSSDADFLKNKTEQYWFYQLFKGTLIPSNI